MNNYKICKQCKKKFPLSFFYRNSNNKDGRVANCKDCVKKKEKEKKEGGGKHKTNKDWIAEGEENMKKAMARYGR